MPATPHIAYRDDILHIEDIPLPGIAEQIPTPCYCYSSAAIESQYASFVQALEGLPATIHYSVKANPALAVLRLMAKLGAGADVVSQGEIRRALAAGIPAEKIIFSGAGKSAEELAFALAANIAQINVESEGELELLSSIAASANTTATIALRINPDVDARTHRKITTGTTESKFGVPWQQTADLLEKAAALPGIRVAGLAMHIGSQITTIPPFTAAFRRLVTLAGKLRDKGFRLESMDLGGGLAANYGTSSPPDLGVREYARAIRDHFAGLPYRLLLEPGRFLVADAGLLLAGVLYEKRTGTRRFLIVDAAMNDLMRPALYDAHHDILPVRKAGGRTERTDVVGPVCESSDTLATGYPLPPMESGSLLAILQTGAYGAALASRYNSRLHAPEVFVSGGNMAVVRPRSSYEAMLAEEQIPPWLATDANSDSQFGMARP